MFTHITFNIFLTIKLILYNSKIHEAPSETFYLGFILYSYLGPVVQSVVSLTSSLRVISLTVLAASIHNILIFFAEKM